MAGNAERSGSHSRDQLATILRGITDGITVQDRSGKLLFANDAAARIMGLASAEELMAMSVEQLMDRYQICGEDSMPLTFADLPGRRALAGVESERIVGFRTPGAELRWSVVRAMPIFDDSSNVVQAINVFRDVTDRRALDEDRERVRRRLTYLAEASRALDEGPLDTASRLSRLAQLAVPRLADGCAVYLRDDEGRLRLHVLAPAGRDVSDNGIAAHEVFRTGKAERDRSTITVPMRAQRRIIGVIRFTSDGEDYDRDDAALAQELADRAGLAVETARLYEASQRAVHDREQLMAWVSHDLRNPLSTISMATELLLRAAAPDQVEKAQRAATNVQRSVERMERLIHDLLDLARIESGGLPLERGHHDLAQLVAEAIDLHASIAAEKQLTLVNEAKSPSPASCDRERMLQLFSNLVDNAVKFTPVGGSIRLGAEAVGGTVKAWVADDGPGIPEAERAKIFDRYWQGRRDSKGVGLGLAIARGVVEAHGGRIWVEGQPGQGARFCLTLPSA